MKHKVITTDKGKIVVDESAEIKRGYFCINEENTILKIKSLVKTENGDILVNCGDVDFSESWLKDCKKIMYTINFSIDKDVAMVILEDEVENLAKKCFRKIYNTEFIGIPTHYELLSVIYKTLTFKAAQQKGVYSEEDLRKAIIMARVGKTYDGDLDISEHIESGYAGCLVFTEEEIIQTLTQETIELETNVLRDKNNEEIIRTNRVNGQLMAYTKK